MTIISPVTRCSWAGTDPLMIAYHDDEWGIPSHDDQHLFEMLVLEGAQAGLSWSTILRKRSAYRKAFADFDPQAVAAFDDSQILTLLADAGIVRNRSKILSAVKNAQAFIGIQAEFGSFDRFVWQFVEGAPKHSVWGDPSQIPARTAESDALSKTLGKRGFTFVGSTICYAFMQSVGMVNDHMRECFRWESCCHTP